MHESATAAITFDHVSLAFDDAVVLHDVSFRVAHGDLVFLLGPSGAGKSVVLKLTLGLLKPDDGSISVYGRRIESLTERELMTVRDQIGMLFQETALFDSLTVAENVGFKLEDERRLDPTAIRRRVEEVLHFVGLESFIERYPAELSGGQRRRVALARAMAAAPRLLLLDDPTVGLDPITAHDVIAEIIKLRDLQRVSTLVVTHQLRDAFYIATHEAVLLGTGVQLRRRSPDRPGRPHFLVLRDGEIRFDGPAQALLDSPDPWIVACLAGWVPPLTLDPEDRLTSTAAPGPAAAAPLAPLAARQPATR